MKLDLANNLLVLDDRELNIEILVDDFIGGTDLSERTMNISFIERIMSNVKYKYEFQSDVANRDGVGIVAKQNGIEVLKYLEMIRVKRDI